MPILVPAILTRSRDELQDKIEFLQQISALSEFQIDFADGKFVEGKTLLPNDLNEIQTRLAVEAHLMVKEPHIFLPDLDELEVARVVFHYEAFKTGHDLLVTINNAAALGMKPAVAVNPETDLEVLRPLSGRVEQVTLLAVRPGYQGQPFLPQSLERLEKLKKMGNWEVEIDGGINIDNFQKVLLAGADRIVVGSGIWHTPDPKKTINSFLKILQKRGK